MEIYQHVRDGRKVRRFKFECVESCHRGTDDPLEFSRHLARCRHILPAVRQRIATALDRGEPIAVDPKPVGERAGQLELL